MVEAKWELLRKLPVKRAISPEALFLLKEGFIENDFDVDTWIDDSFIKEAEEELRKERSLANAS